jgi:C4-dicarboxylate transporter DctM subunit
VVPAGAIGQAHPVAANIDLIHFGDLMSVNLTMAHLRSPVGVGLFLVVKVGKVPFETAAKWALSFIACEVLVTRLVTFFPSIALQLTRHL